MGHFDIEEALPDDLRSPRLVSALQAWRRLMPDDLLRAAVLDPDRALAAFERVREQVDFANIAHAQLLPQVHHSLGSRLTGDPLEPDLKIMRVHNAFHNQTLFRQFRDIAGQLRGRGLDFLAFKGVALAPTVYPDPSCRRVGDMDLLVREADYDRAVTQLIALGWSPVRVSNAAGAVLARKFVPGIAWQHADHDVDLDLHAHINHHAVWPGSDDIYWERTQDYSLDSVSIPTLSDEDHLLQVCVHGLAQNYYPPVRWALDAHWILRAGGDGFDWDRLMATAEQTQSSGRLAVALAYTRDILEADIPRSVTEHLRSTGSRPRYAREWSHQLVRSESAAGKLAYAWNRFREARAHEALIPALRHLPDFLRFVTQRRTVVSAVAVICRRVMQDVRRRRREAKTVEPPPGEPGEG